MPQGNSSLSFVIRHYRVSFVRGPLPQGRVSAQTDEVVFATCLKQNACWNRLKAIVLCSIVLLSVTTVLVCFGSLSQGRIGTPGVVVFASCLKQCIVEQTIERVREPRRASTACYIASPT